jgi:hypothetical protein
MGTIPKPDAIFSIGGTCHHPEEPGTPDAERIRRFTSELRHGDIVWDIGPGFEANSSLMMRNYADTHRLRDLEVYAIDPNIDAEVLGKIHRIRARYQDIAKELRLLEHEISDERSSVLGLGEVALKAEVHVFLMAGCKRSKESEGAVLDLTKLLKDNGYTLIGGQTFRDPYVFAVRRKPEQPVLVGGRYVPESAAGLAMEMHRRTDGDD